MAKATLTCKGLSGPPIGSGTFYNYELNFTGVVAFPVTMFQPHNSTSQETLAKIESPEGDMLFHAKKQLAGRGSLILLREVGEDWVVCRFIGSRRHSHIDKVWVVSAEGVEYPEVERAIAIKEQVAEMEECEVALTPTEQVHKLMKEKEAEAEAADRRRKQQEATAAERLKKERERQEARAARNARKIQLRSSGNIRKFTTAGGKSWAGFVVKDKEEAMMLESGDRAVFLSEDGRRVVQVLLVHKTGGGRPSFDEIKLGESTALSPAAGSGASAGAVESPQLRAFDTFRRPKEKRREGEKDTVAYYVTEAQFEHLRVYRPEEPKTVAVKGEDGRFHVYVIGSRRVDDKGFMEKVRPSVSEPKKPPVLKGCRYKAVA